MTEFDKSILWKIRSRKRQVSSASLSEQQQVENRVTYARKNGHRKQPTGRTEQMNFRVKAELKSCIQAECEKRGVMSAVLLEEMWQAYLDRAGGGP